MTDLTVTTGSGPVRGLRRDGCTVFFDIPYAAPMLGVDRFLEPRQHERWRGVRDAVEPGPTAPQASRPFGTLDMSPYFGPGWIEGDDPLTVTIRRPDDDRTTHPVMVFVHGGGFVAGSTRSSLYDGTSFARDGVVLVTLNYRLGIQGFLDIPGAPRNRGLLDVLAALEWVQRTIGEFGGDPDDVTVFGQSAGAILVASVLVAPGAERLVRRAVMQSGTATGAFTPEQGRRLTDAAARHLDIEPTLDAFASVSDRRLVDVQADLVGLDLDTTAAVDPLVGISAFSLTLDEQPLDAVRRGAGGGIDLLLGSNSEEGNLYLVPQGTYDTATDEDLVALAARTHRQPDRLVEEYRAESPGATLAELRARVLGDALFRTGTGRLADARAEHSGANTYRYEFGWRSNALGGRLGATHTMELPFVFDVAGRPDLHGEQKMLGPSPVLGSLAARMHGAWVAFAADGDPGWARYRVPEQVVQRFE